MWIDFIQNMQSSNRAYILDMVPKINHETALRSKEVTIAHVVEQSPYKIYTYEKGPSRCYYYEITYTIRPCCSESGYLIGCPLFNDLEIRKL